MRFSVFWDVTLHNIPEEQRPNLKPITDCLQIYTIYQMFYKNQILIEQYDLRSQWDLVIVPKRLIIPVVMINSPSKPSRDVDDAIVPLFPQANSFLLEVPIPALQRNSILWVFLHKEMSGFQLSQILLLVLVQLLSAMVWSVCFHKLKIIIYLREFLDWLTVMRSCCNQHCVFTQNAVLWCIIGGVSSGPLY